MSINGGYGRLYKRGKQLRAINRPYCSRTVEYQDLELACPGQIAVEMINNLTLDQGRRRLWERCEGRIARDHTAIKEAE
jgi:hypothetical protein